MLELLKEDSVFYSQEIELDIDPQGENIPVSPSAYGYWAYDDFDTDQVNFFDMNGDNKADMVYQGDGNEVWHYKSNGTTFNAADQIADFAGSLVLKSQHHYMPSFVYQIWHQHFQYYVH